MKVLNHYIANQSHIKFCFKGNDEWHVFGIDEGGQSKRDYIRKWHEENYVPYQSIYEKEKRLSEFELTNLLKQFIKKPTLLNNEIITKIGLYNLGQLGTTNSYKGAMIRGYETEKLLLLKDAGIKRIASLIKSDELEEECNKYGIEYLYFDLNTRDSSMKDKQFVENNARSYWKNIANIKDNNLLEMYTQKDVSNWEKESKKSIEKLITFIKFMQKDNVYLGCACGTSRTDFAVIINNLFNPLANYNCDLSEFLNIQKALENLYKNLTESDKLKMNWTKSFDKEFIPRLNKLTKSLL